MRIGFDAKRFFHNTTGLGNYSRTLVKGLINYFPQHQYFLFNPKPEKGYPLPINDNVFEVGPKGFLSRQFPSLWRSLWMTDDIRAQNINLFHGLSHELPKGIARAGVQSVVTVHDLIFERYPRQYGMYEVRMHRHKIQYACRHANLVIATSEHTRQDLMDKYRVAEEKIKVVYQSCDPAFGQANDPQLQEQIRHHYKLPEQFFLYVGSIIERKNLLGICKALQSLKGALTMPLVVVGEGNGPYKERVKRFIADHQLEQQVLFLSGISGVPEDYSLHQTKNLAALYRVSRAFIYPSFFEGFGIPVLEAMCSGVPVITSSQTSMEEIAGDAACLVNPANAEDMATAMLQLQNDDRLHTNLAARGLQRAELFSLENCTRQLMQAYQKIGNDRIL